MEIIDIFQKPLQKAPTVLALGLFDGVHIGHKALLKETVRIAKEKGVLPAVFTFHQTAYKKAPSLYPREVTYRQMEALGIGRIYEADFSYPTALVVGSEGKGVSRLVSETVDEVLSIDMFGHVNSLNASNASAIAVYEVVRQRSK